MARWLIKIDGEWIDVEEFPHRFPDGNLYAIQKDNGVYLTGPEFEALPGAEQVRSHAMAALEEMAAVISLFWPALRKPVIGNVQREDDHGGVSNWVFVPGAVIRVKASLDMVVIRSDGARESVRTEDVRPTEAQRLLAASRTTRNLRGALVLWIAAEPAWWSLYRIVEDLERHLGTSISKAGLCSDKERTLFRRSANSAEASGLGARHAAGNTVPPTHPMTLEVATVFVRGLLGNVLRL